MLAQLEQHASVLKDARALRGRHVLIVLPRAADPQKLRALPFVGALQAALTRRKKSPDELGKSVITTESEGVLVSWVAPDPAQPLFERHTLVRKGVQALLAENPQEIAIALYGDAKTRASAAAAALYVAWVNGARLPQRKKKSDAAALDRIQLYGHREADAFAALRAQAEGNVLCRELTVLPPNDLTPASYRERLREYAKAERWAIDELDMKRLRAMRAGAFVAVAQGSETEDAAIVRLAYAPRGAKRKIALVGKGICFDTGGHNLKPAKYMAGMHEDMNGSAVALGILLAATRARLPVAIDCWLAIAQNHISPRAYKQNEVVAALNGTTIEVVHTDAEGRMVLADTLTLASRAKPDLMIDFATLTGSMHTALGDRYSGIFASDDAIARRALDAARASGERVCVFPSTVDYDEALESTIADVKQCTLEGAADHILAVRFLRRFVDDRPWIHMDLSASSCKGGLGAIGSDVTGFGVAWGFHLLRSLARR